MGTFNSTYNSADNYKFDNSSIDAREDAERRKRRRVYSTTTINELLNEASNGYDIPYDAFFQKDLELRAANVTFRMTPEEREIFQRCYDDANFYVENYCKFMTDNGRQTVDLRDFQRKIIKTVTDETYIEKLDDFGPKNRNIIWMASRQSGKCVFSLNINKLDSLTESKTLTKTLAENVVYKEKSTKSCSERLRHFLIKLYMKKRLPKTIIGYLIQAIESYQYRNLDLDENDISKKIIDEVPVDFYIETPEGPSHVSKIYKTQPYHIYEITLEEGTKIECADNHIMYIGTENFVFETYAKNIKVGDHIVTRDGDKEVVRINTTPYKMSMYDISVDNNTHTYYSADGVMNHNTTTVAAFLSWMIVFHPDRNILVVANKEKTAIEIVDKITNIFRGLPYFMKPGCINFGKMSVKLENGSQIICSATTNTASIGFTIHCVLLDEFAHIPDNIVNNFWRSVYPTLSSSAISQCIITSTPNGTTNKFYDIWDKSINGRNSFVNMRTDYYEVPGHDQAWADQMRADFGEEEFAQEFELQFNINSKMIAKTDDLQFMGRIAQDYVHKEIYIDNKYLKDEHIYWHPDFDPNEIQDDDKFLFLVDLAEGLNDDKAFKTKKREPDYNTINIFKVVPNSIANIRKYGKLSCKIEDAFRYVQVGKYTSNEDDEIQCANVCAALAYDLMHDDERESVRVALEMNFNGKSFTQTFQSHPKYYDGTIQRTYHTKPVPGEVQRRRLGFKTTGNKEHYCLKGAKLLNMRRIIVTDRETMYQVQSFGYVKGKLMGIACHDDLSMPVFNHVPRMLDEETFKGWLEEILSGLKDEVKKFTINNMLELWDMDNPEITDEEFDAMYMKNDSFPTMTSQSVNPYSSNNFSINGSPGMAGFTGRNPYSTR